MSRQRHQFSTEFKTKVVLELFGGEQTLNQVASKYNVLPKDFQRAILAFLCNFMHKFKRHYGLKYKS